MLIEIIVLLCMIFCHIIDDYGLQARCLSNLKQKKFWEDNAPDDMYKYDYLMALFMHSFSWAFMISAPLIIYAVLNNTVRWLHICLMLANLIIHFIVDDLKANRRKINLIQDQMIHIVQIVATWIICMI